jgi:hypothetical protein
MLKTFSKSDITVRPFVAFKNWTLQSINSSSVDAYGDSTWYGNGAMTVNEGLYITGSFYDSSSVYYNSGSDPINFLSGEYKRITWNVTDAMFYRNLDNPMNLFGVTQIGQNPITKAEEIREIHDRLLTARINQNYWGEAINPSSVVLSDYSNLHEAFTVLDDGITNLYISGGHFPFIDIVSPYNAAESQSFWSTSSGQFYYNGYPITYIQAQEAKSAGAVVSYTPDSSSWQWIITASIYHPENERFGYSVAAWNQYVLAGSPTDLNTSEPKKNGFADLFKYDSVEQRHRWINKFTSPFTSSYLDGFGHSVSIRDDFAVIGSPTEAQCSTATGSGIVYVYYKYFGGSDFWGMTNIIECTSTGSDRFGDSVSHDSGILAIGAPGTNNNAGAVYIYRQKQYDTGSCMGIPMPTFWQQICSESGSCTVLISETGSFIYDEQPTPYFISGNYSWEYETIITSSNPGDFFGSCVSISNNRLLIGTHITGSNGYAVLYTASYSSSNGACPTASWLPFQTYVSNNDLADLDLNSPVYFQNVPLPYDGFGYKVSIDGDQFAICSFYDTAFTPFFGSGITQSLGAVYFYSFGFDPNCGIYDCALRYKTFGDRSQTINNNFARSVAVSNGYAAVGYLADQTIHSASLITGSFILNGWTSYATNSFDQNMTLGRVSLYSFNASSGSSWDLITTLKRSKEQGYPYYNYGYSTALSDLNANSGSMFLAVGGPVFAYTPDLVSLNYIVTQSLLDNTFMSSSLHGATYIYNISEFTDEPKIGNVFYQNGQLVVTTTASNYSTIMSSTGSTGFSLAYQGTQTIYEHEYLISLTPGMCNYSTNQSSLANYPLLFDVNQDGIFNALDISLILGFLNQQKFYISQDTDDNGLVLEQSTFLGIDWWTNEILQTESGDVLYLEQLGVPAGTTYLSPEISAYIQSNLINSGILDIDGNGIIDIRDGGILLNYYLGTLTATTLSQFLDAKSTRVYYNDVKTYLDQYTGKLPFNVSPNFLGYIESSSFDLTGSYLAPYITSIGLYDDSGELALVAKLGNPIKSLIDWPMNIIVRFDT